MLRRKVIVRDVHGLHLRPAANIVKTCRGISSRITLWKGRNNTEGTSILGLLLLDAQAGSEIEICAEGTDEELAMRRVIALF